MPLHNTIRHTVHVMNGQHTQQRLTVMLFIYIKIPTCPHTNVSAKMFNDKKIFINKKLFLNFFAKLHMLIHFGVFSCSLQFQWKNSTKKGRIPRIQCVDHGACSNFTTPIHISFHPILYNFYSHPTHFFSTSIFLSIPSIPCHFCSIPIMHLSFFLRTHLLFSLSTHCNTHRLFVLNVFRWYNKFHFYPFCFQLLSILSSFLFSLLFAILFSKTNLVKMT